ncbi:TetR/AcrR family transcriptional regulator [Pedobacter sp. BS3]|uniref:TetR/AcrR family transcriptional regulator n=1 Tax=Pedobacter sp. BS3 TaxID=2567937 RepID=UPI0016592A80|nr:TetR/AcrR family transcriptional regulator [Pedobacter sp. BS3]
MSPEPSIQEDILPEQILQAALQLYLRHGLKKVTMDDVSKVIGKSRSTLYYYYKNRDEIFEAVMDALIREVLDEITRTVDQADTVENKIRAFCLAKIKTSEDRRPVFTAMEAGMDADEISRHAKTMSGVHRRLMKAEAELLKKVLTTGVKNSQIRPLRPKEQDMLIFILLSGIRGIRREMRHENNFSNLKPAVDTLTAMAMKWLAE